MSSEASPLGYSVAVTFGDCDPEFFTQPEWISSALHAACGAAGYTIVAEVSHAFTPYGITHALILSQSHLVCHTWPEHRLVSVDLFACAPRETINQALKIIKTATGAQWMSGSHQVRELTIDEDGVALPSAAQLEDLTDQL